MLPLRPTLVEVGRFFFAVEKTADLVHLGVDFGPSVINLCFIQFVQSV